MDLRPHICIIGGGFGGLYTALYLQRYRHLKQARITLVEPRDQFLFTPMLYEVLTEELQVWEVAPTYSSLLMGTNVDWRQTWAEDIDLAQQQVHLREGDPLSYDYLVVATGAVTRIFDLPGIEHTLAFRTLDEALTLKSRLDQLATLQPAATVTVIGAGASGVELAAKVADRLGPQATITLIDRADIILAPFESGLRQAALKALQKRRVDIRLQVEIGTIGPTHIDGQQQGIPFQLPSDLTIWAVGTQPAGWPMQVPVPTNQQGQVYVQPTLQLIDHPQIFGLGDSAVIQSTVGRPAPNTAQAAFQAAATVAANLAALTRQQPRLKSFHYLHLGNMLTLGAYVGGVWSFGLTLSGWLGGFIRRVVYIFRMPTQRHQLKVLRQALRQLFGQVWAGGQGSRSKKSGRYQNS